ncbi:MAG: HepT-like ribonuclease domain-containing protein [Pseudomonadota bacterium]
MKGKARSDFDGDPYLRDIVERNLEIAAQCCIDISHRIISLEKAQKPRDYYEAIIRMGELGVVPSDFARRLALSMSHKFLLDTDAMQVLDVRKLF